MTERKLEPHIRFKGFEEEWKKEKLGELGHTFSGLSGKSKNDFGHGKAKYVTYMNVYTNPIASKKELDAIEIDQKQHSVKYGDVFFTTSSETPEEVGMSSVWQYNWDNVYLNSFSFGYRPDKIFNLNYLAFVLRSQAVRNKIKVLAQGISRYNISKVKMMDIKVPFPNIAEQQKIGTFFAKLDRLLDLQQQKLDQLELLKKALLQKLFPKQDAKIPELRFKGFKEEWEKDNLSHMAPVRGGFAFSSSNFLKSGIPIMRISNILPEGKTGGEYVYYSKMKDDGSFKLKKGDCVIAMSGATTGKSAIIKDKFDTYYQNQRVGLFQHNENYCYEFVVTLIKSNNFLAQLKRVLIQGAQPNVSASEIDSFVFSIPKEYCEQQKIGNLLAKVDRLIELENKKFSNLKLVKKSLLQNMFVE